MYKVIGSIIYSFINNIICPDYLGILQKHLSAYNDFFLKKQSSMLCLVWVFLKFQ